MTERRERVAGQSIRGSRIAAAVGVGILVGCIFAFLFPNGFLGSDPPQEHKSAKSAVQGGLQKVAIDAAVEDINSNPAVLGGRKLVLNMQDANFSGFLGVVKGFTNVNIGSSSI